MQNKPIKVLIADDEPLVRKGLKAMVDWKKYEMEVVADVPNGEAAWEVFNVHKPELIISDIVMPVMDGIELLKKVKRMSPMTKMLFLSCHSDFQYAQEGIRLGISGYLLKTSFNDKDIDTYLYAIRDELRRFQSTGEGENRFSLQDEMDSLFTEWIEDSDPNSGKKWLLRHTESHPFLQSPPLTLVHLCGEIEDEAISALQCALRPASSYIQNNAGAIGTFFVFSRTLYPKCMSHLSVLQPVRGEPLWSVRDGLQDADDLLSAIQTLSLRERYRTEYGLKAADCPDSIVEAIAYMMMHLNVAISSTEVADRVGLSRSYFSMQFKKSVGISFLEFLDRRRLEQSQDLLTATDWRLYDIAERVGIPDAKYFSKWFRKETGLTPSEYRERTKVHL